MTNINLNNVYILYLLKNFFFITKFQSNYDFSISLRGSIVPSTSTFSTYVGFIFFYYVVTIFLLVNERGILGFISFFSLRRSVSVNYFLPTSFSSIFMSFVIFSILFVAAPKKAFFNLFYIFNFTLSFYIFFFSTLRPVSSLFSSSFFEYKNYLKVNSSSRRV